MLGTIDRDRFDLLIEVNSLINSKYADASILIESIIESSTRLVAAEAASLVLHDAVSGKLSFAVATGPRNAQLTGASMPLGQGIVGWVAEKGTPIIVNDPERDPRFSASMAHDLDFPVRSVIAVPMKVKGKLVGVIEVLNKVRGRYFTEEDLSWLEIFSQQAAIAVENARYLQRTSAEIAYLSDKAVEAAGWHNMIFASKAMDEKLRLVDRIALSDASVLILGESGVGKELVAERIHRMSKRSEKPFVRVNCAALPENLLESELFGHVKGAFTDAVNDRKGRFELAEGGTIFLDEIAELPLKLQSKLLRVIQQKSFERVGSSTTMTVDTRIIAATNQDLAALVERQAFRADLFYRLNVLPILIPPLRERKEDILVLAEHFLKRAAREMNKPILGFSDTAMEALLSYAWPGNVRELENAVERAVVLGLSDMVLASDLMIGSERSEAQDYRGKNLRDAMNAFKASFLRNALALHGWNQTATAKALDIQRTYLSRLIKELKITQPKE